MSDLRSLIEAAKTDAPSNAARAKVWAGVSSVVGEAAALGAGSAVAGSAGAAKLLLLGGLLGGSLTVGIGAAVLVMRPAHTASPTSAAATLVAHAPAAGAVQPAAGGRPYADGQPSVAANARPKASEAALAPRPSSPAATRRPADRPTGAGPEGRSASAPGRGADVGSRETATDDNTLAREASQLAEARNALVRRDALSALQIVRGLRALPKRQLMPEELAIEAQALRALGLNGEADAVDARLRIQYPDSVLDR